MTYAIDSEPLWKPNPATVGDTRMAQLMQAMGRESLRRSLAMVGRPAGSLLVGNLGFLRRSR